MTAEPVAIETVRRLMEGLTSDDLRACLLEALRRWRRSALEGDEFPMNGEFGRAIVRIVAERKGVPAPETQREKEVFLSEQAQPWMAGVVEFTWWLVRAGLAIPLYKQGTLYPFAFRLTAAGARLLDTADDHPLLPGFLARISSRCQGIPDEVLSHVGDARECLDHALLRPSVVLLGLANEVAIENVVEALVSQGKLPAKVLKAKPGEKIDAVREIIPHLVAGADERSAALAAWDFAHILRRRRNDGAHPRPAYDFSDTAEVHELVQSMGRHLPAIWSTGKT